MKNKFVLALAAASLAVPLFSCSNANDSSSNGEANAEVPYEVTSRLNSLLGVYQELEYSPLPLLDGKTYSVDADNVNAVKAANVSEGELAAYKQTLLDAGFTASGDSLLDKTETYLVTLTLADNTLTTDISFNDVAGDFPVNYLSTISPALDMSLYLDGATFEAVKNIKGEDLSAKFKTLYTKDISGYSGKTTEAKFVTYTPKDDDDDPVDTVLEWLSSTSAFTALSTTYGLYTDAFNSTLLYAGLVGANTPKLLANGASEGDVYVKLERAWTYEEDSNVVKYMFENYSGFEYNAEDFYDFNQLGDAHGMVLATSGASSYGPGWMISNVDKAKYQEMLDWFYDAGWSYTKSTGTYYASFNLYGPKREYRIFTRYYDSTKVNGLMSDMAMIRVYGLQDVYDLLEEWLVGNNQGGGTVTSITEIPGSGISYSSGWSSMYPYFQLSASKVNETAYNQYLSVLVDDGWVLDSDSSTTYERLYATEDNFYQLSISYDNVAQTFAMTLIYNSYKYSGKLTYSDIMKYAALRMGVSSLSVPGLTDYVSDAETTDITFFSAHGVSTSNKYHRVLATIPMKNATALSDVEAVVTVLNEKLSEEGSGWTSVGANSSGTTFFENGNVVLYFGANSAEDDDGNTSYYLMVGMYLDE